VSVWPGLGLIALCAIAGGLIGVGLARLLEESWELAREGRNTGVTRGWVRRVLRPLLRWDDEQRKVFQTPWHNPRP